MLEGLKLRCCCSGLVSRVRGVISLWVLPAYLREVTWRFSYRKSQHLFRGTLIRLLQSDNLEYKELTKAA
jgi:hypothetical protein